MTKVERLFVHRSDTIQEAIAIIQGGHVGIALVVDENRRLIATITDGDIRRAILNKVDLSTEIGTWLDGLSPSHPKPTAMPMGTAPGLLLQIMKDKVLQQIPLLDDQGRITELVLLTELIQDSPLPVSAVVLAGGLGQRLRPLTEKIPKPLLKIGDKPILQLIIERLVAHGFKRILISVCYKAEMIQEYFGDGSKFGVNIEYLKEEQLTGTAGPLRLAQGKIETPFLVVNGDLLTEVNFESLLEFHSEGCFDLTVAVKNYSFQVPYGVLRLAEDNVVALEEKPTQRFFVNAGIYVLNPDLLELIPENRYFDLTDLINELLKQGRAVGGFPIYEYWLDVGNQDTFRQANADHGESLE